jgi:hypothetical protein
MHVTAMATNPGARQPAHREPHGLSRAVQPLTHPHAVLPALGRGVKALARLVDGAEAPLRLGARGVGRHPLARELLGAQPQVQADLLVGLGVRRLGAAHREAEEAPHAGADLVGSHARPQAGPAAAVRMPVTVWA